ncbi:hypothetical protein EUGRSUZ_K00855 [Eucalyptus grandis]|uniref:Uncharacterized protein n=2 Tax=Eucalyptus grandis TaxID=71139 RepID=A0ACC3IRI7_EUCGR|nr:hypothetical protein EUGRSUZ_K00855 [Eucalyptus grandis]
MNIFVKVPLWDTGLMSSSQPLLYLKSLILMLVPCLERKCVSKWMHDSQREEVALLSLEFCNHCMCITSENRGFRPRPPRLEGFDGFPQLFLKFSTTLYEPGHSHQIRSRGNRLKFVTKLSHPILGSTLLRLPCTRERLLGYISDYINMWNSWHEEATQVQHLASRRSFENGMSQRQRNSRGYISRATRKLNLSWLCFCINT